MKTTFKSPARCKGLTLIEIMIALVIGSLLMVGAMGLFVSNKRIYKEQDSMGRLQENARFALNLMISDIRRAGYVGCSDAMATVANTLTGAGTATNLISFTNAIEGSENAAIWVPSASTEAIASVLPLQPNPNTGAMQTRPDSITVRYLSPLDDEISLSANMANGGAATVVPVACDPNADCTVDDPIAQFENIALSDCASTDIFAVSAVTASSLAHAGVALSKGYDSTSQLSRYVTNRYFVGNGINDRSGNPIPTLFRFTFAQDKDDSDGDSNTAEFVAYNQPLIEGIENLQILYGEDTAGADTVADTYVNAAAVTNWANVVSVRLAILVRTTEPNFNGTINNTAYTLLGSNIYTTVNPAGDFHRRRVFSATIQIRNRSI
jgi:type IV pilus assembly protein PilW